MAAGGRPAVRGWPAASAQKAPHRAPKGGQNGAQKSSEMEPFWELPEAGNALFCCSFHSKPYINGSQKDIPKGPRKATQKEPKWGPEKTLCNNQMGGRLAREASPGLIIIA